MCSFCLANGRLLNGAGRVESNGLRTVVSGQRCAQIATAPKKPYRDDTAAITKGDEDLVSQRGGLGGGDCGICRGAGGRGCTGLGASAKVECGLTREDCVFEGCCWVGKGSGLFFRCCREEGEIKEGVAVERERRVCILES